MGAPEAADEFRFLPDIADELGLVRPPAGLVRRIPVHVSGGRSLSALLWGESRPQIVFLHGGSQNAHTWDSVALLLDRPLVAVDLPAHGHSDGARNWWNDPFDLAADVAVAVRTLAPDALGVVGMSLGGLTALAMTRDTPQLIRSLVLVDITPGVTAEVAAPIMDFIWGPESFASFDEILRYAEKNLPGRSSRSLYRGVVHNSVELPDGSWTWRYRRHRPAHPGADASVDFRAMWDLVDELGVPLMLLRGTRPGSVVSDDDVQELRRRLPQSAVKAIDGGHSLQGEQPVDVAAALVEWFGL